MTIDGSWTIKMDTPIGPQEGALVLSADNGALTGYMDQLGNKSELEEGTISDDGDLTWQISVHKPMKLSVKITAKYDGENKITGSAKMGIIGGATLEAVRN